MKLGILEIPDFITDLIPTKNDNRQSNSAIQKGTADEILNDFCSKIRRGSQFDMERQVHDMIIGNVKYDDSGKQIDHDALGPLLNKSGVCDGISKLAVMVFDRIGIQSKMVVGDLCIGGSEQGPHAWNKVRIDGEWYNLDITQDLGFSDGKKPFRYDYFNLSDKEILRDHRLNSNPVPCNRSGMDYYTRMDMAVSTFSEYLLYLKKEFSSGGKVVSVKLPLGLDLKRAESRLVHAAVEEYSKRHLGNVTAEYSSNPDQGIFYVRLKSQL